MEQTFKNKIEASNTNINRLLKGQKFIIDYFQREYRWQEKHIKLLIDDLTGTFLKSYNKDHKRSEVASYQNYYLGPVVFNINSATGKKSIIDGQQRITSITLLLIYLNHQQANSSQKVTISDLIFSERFGEKSFNMSDENREDCFQSLFENGVYQVKETDDETIQNIVDRYENIVNVFPEEIDGNALPYFIDWFIENVVIVEITAYSDENAYTIFETMNDRGLNLTPTEMLKGYVLSKLANKQQRTEINSLWKTEIQKLHAYEENADLNFFQSWFRAKYAVTIRSGKIGSENQDFELIGSRFHNWFKDNHKSLFNLNTPNEFYDFFLNQFPFFVKWYLATKKALKNYDTSMPHLNYIANWGIAESLQDPLLIASVNYGNSDSEIKSKIDLAARYIENFTVLRAINFRKFGQTSIKYTMFNVIKSIRNNSLKQLGENLAKEVGNIPEKMSAVLKFALHGMNKHFVKHLLCRITAYVDSLVGKKDNTYVTYHHPTGKQYEIEHIWANKFENHLDEFEQKTDFNDWRNSIGALVLLPNGTNQSFGNSEYSVKVEHYLKENTYVQTLHKMFYQNNPNFLNSAEVQELQFKYHEFFKKQDIEERKNLLKRICEKIWSIKHFEI